MCQTVHDPADESWQEGGRERVCERAAAVCCRRRVEVARRQQSRVRAFLSLPEEQGAPSLVQLLEGGSKRDFQLLVASTSLPLRALDWVTESKFAKQTLRRYL